jgi:hypothetical protein
MLDRPAGIVTDAGVVATNGVSLESETAIPPIGAGPFNLTVPVEFFPPVILVGDNVTVETTEGFTVKAFCFTDAPPLAVIVMGLGFKTASVVMLKLALVSPAGTVTLAGIVATVVSLEVRLIVTPPAYATAGSVTVPRTVAPFTMLEEDKLKVEITGRTVTLAYA